MKLIPPCSMNLLTECSYTKHQWEIVSNVLLKKTVDEYEPVYFYKVRCKRCGLNHPDYTAFPH